MIASLLDTPPFGGKDNPGRLYVALWMYEFGDSFVEIGDPAQIALEAGYTTSRAERTFGERLELLSRLGFVRIRPLGLRPHGYVLLLNPHTVLWAIRARQPEAIPEYWWSAFEARCSAVGLRVAPPAVEENDGDDGDDGDDEDDDS